MEEVKACSHLELSVFCLDPSYRVHILVAPLVQALETDLHQAIKNPQEAKAFCGEQVDAYAEDLLVAHCVVIHFEIVVAKHLARVVPLAAFNAPRRVNKHDIKVEATFFCKMHHVEIAKIAIDECGLEAGLFLCLTILFRFFFLVKHTQIYKIRLQLPHRHSLRCIKIL